MLYTVATPIGNLEDITFRAVRILGEVDIIACEDTRTSLKLLAHYGIKKELLSYHSHSGKAKTEKILEYLNAGKKVALISDAGTPGISDPGYALVQEVLASGFEVVPIPGVTACTTALQASGLQMNHFLYLGFLPIKKGRQTLLEKLFLLKADKKFSQTFVIYESVHRIERTLTDFASYFGKETQVVVARELTKKFESFYRGSLEEISQFFLENPSKIKGEFVILL